MLPGKLAFVLLISTLVQDIRRCSVVADELPIQHGVNFVGIGYNIVDGNPEGGDLSTGGVDPGLLPSRRIFKFTFDQEKKTSDQQNRIPDEVVFLRRSSAFTTSSLSTFHGTKSYASKLSSQVEVSAGYEGATAGFNFAASARYQSVAQKTTSHGSVFLSNETIKNFGVARYQVELAQTGNHLLTDGFVADSCRLPATYTDETKKNYMKFMNDWGTHVVTEVALGMKQGENFEEDRSAFVNYAARNVGGSINATGEYLNFKASLSVDMESFTSAMDSGTSFGQSYSTYTAGSEALNEPISLKLIAMPEVFLPAFWTGLDGYIAAGHCTTSFDKDSVKDNLVKALKEYGVSRNLKESSNPVIRVPLTWPEGVYGLPKPFNVCPKDFYSGYRVHYQGVTHRNQFSTDLFHSDLGGFWTTFYVEQYFCMKTVSKFPDSTWQWQPGSYCIYQYGSRCPTGFETGLIHWDDDNMYALANYKEGMIPSGKYGENTEINFCCRSDGVTSQAIYLPTDTKFILLARFGRCQLVHGMKVKTEWIYWHSEGNSRQSGVHPYNGVYGNGVRLIYCIYYRKDEVEDLAERYRQRERIFVEGYQ